MRSYFGTEIRVLPEAAMPVMEEGRDPTSDRTLEDNLVKALTAGETLIVTFPVGWSVSPLVYESFSYERIK